MASGLAGQSLAGYHGTRALRRSCIIDMAAGTDPKFCTSILGLVDPMDAQQILTLLLALVASGYLLRRGWLSLRGKGNGCGSCSECPADLTEENMPVRKALYTLGKPK